MRFAHRYRACGLSIAANVPVPGLPESDEDLQPDVRVSMNGGAPPAVSETGAESLRYVSGELGSDRTPVLTMWARPTGDYRLNYSEGAQFLVGSNGCRVDVYWSAPLLAADAAVYLLGPVLGFLMRLRGTVPVHASAVVVGGRSVLFVGDGGAGKSTTAAVIASLGYPVLADDMVPIVSRGEEVLACPGHPRLSVWPDSAEALFGSADALPCVSPTYDKRYLDLADHGYDFARRPMPIEAVYLLGSRSLHGGGRVAQRLSPRSALMALVRNTYCNYLLDAPMRAQEFDVLSHLVDHVPVREVAFTDDLRRLPESCRALVSEILTEAAGQHV